MRGFAPIWRFLLDPAEPALPRLLNLAPDLGDMRPDRGAAGLILYMIGEARGVIQGRGQFRRHPYTAGRRWRRRGSIRSRDRGR